MQGRMVPVSVSNFNLQKNQKIWAEFENQASDVCKA